MSSFSSSSASLLSSGGVSAATGLTSASAATSSIRALNLLSSSSSSSSSGNSTLTLEQLLGYQPNEAAALIFCFLFVLSALMLLVLSCRTRSWFVFIGVFTAIAEAGGFGLRFLIARDTTINIGPYVGSTLLILVAPNGLAALNYSALARMIRVFLVAQTDDKADSVGWRRIPYLTDGAGRMRPARVSRTFILSDVLCMVLQFAGSIMAGSTDPSQVSTGQSLIVAGFSLQFIFLGLYTLLIARLYALHCALKRQGAKLELRDKSLYLTSRLDKAFVCIAATISLIIGRNVYRMIEAENRAVSSRELYTYLFDALLIFICFVVFSVLHFGFFLPRSPPVSRVGGKLNADEEV